MICGDATSSNPTPMRTIWFHRETDVTSGYTEVPGPQEKFTMYNMSRPQPAIKVTKKKSWLRKFFWE